MILNNFGLVMIHKLVLSCSCLLLLGCVAQDASYYQKHPQQLEAALKNCPNQPPKDMSCEQLAHLAVEMNQLAYQLQLNPQGFGQKILALQALLAEQKKNMAENPNQVELKNKFEQNKRQLEQYLAVVKWLESPER